MIVYCVFKKEDFEYPDLMRIFDTIEKAQKYVDEGKSVYFDLEIVNWKVE